MFRPMRRKAQQLPQEVCQSLLKTLPRGVLSLLGDQGYPYGVPMDFFYREEDGCLYFHSAPEGHKLDAMAACSKASFCCYDEGYREDGDWALNIRSVIVFGQIQPVPEEDLRRLVMEQFVRKYTQEEAYVQRMLQQFLAKAVLFRLVPDHITGKLVNES